LLLNVLFLRQASVELENLGLQSQELLLILIQRDLELIDLELVLAALFLEQDRQLLDLLVLLNTHGFHLLGHSQQVGLVLIVELLVLSLELALLLGSLLLKTLQLSQVFTSASLTLLEQSLELRCELILLLLEGSLVAILQVCELVRVSTRLIVKLLVPKLLRR